MIIGFQYNISIIDLTEDQIVNNQYVLKIYSDIKTVF